MAVLPALRDAGQSGITEEFTRDVIDVGGMPGVGIHKLIPGPEEYTVTYTGRNAKYVNGELTEAWSP